MEADLRDAENAVDEEDGSGGSSQGTKGVGQGTEAGEDSSECVWWCECVHSLHINSSSPLLALSPPSPLVSSSSAADYSSGDDSEGEGSGDEGEEDYDYEEGGEREAYRSAVENRVGRGGGRGIWMRVVTGRSHLHASHSALFLSLSPPLSLSPFLSPSLPSCDSGGGKKGDYEQGAGQKGSGDDYDYEEGGGAGEDYEATQEEIDYELRNLAKKGDKQPEKKGDQQKGGQQEGKKGPR